MSPSATLAEPTSSAARTRGAGQLTFRWGILGTGHAARKFALGLRQSEVPATVALVASRSAVNAQRFARDMSVPQAVVSYDEAVAAADGVDAYYIATPPREHRPLALRCIEAGKPVLIEKPFAVDATAAEEIVDAARRHGVFCMEGMWMRFLPLVRDLKRMVDDGSIGEVRAISGSFGSATTPAVDKALYDAELGGGALLHRGIYPLSMASHLMGAPVDVMSSATLTESGIDEESVVVARHSQGGISTAFSSLRTQPANDCSVLGTSATVHVDAPIYRPYRMTITRVGTPVDCASAGVRLERLKEGPVLQRVNQRVSSLRRLARGGSSSTVTRFYDGNGYHYEADEVARCIQAGALESEVMPLDESLDVARAITLARAQWPR